MTIYSLRRRTLVSAIRFIRLCGGNGDLRQARMELAALRNCRALVS